MAPRSPGWCPDSSSRHRSVENQKLSAEAFVGNPILWPDALLSRDTNLPGMRQQCFTLLLPDETVLVIGGSTTHPSDWSGYWFDGVQLPEVYSPAQGQWTTLQAPATVPRVYHGVALLLPDGRIWTAGSNPFGDGQRQDFEHRIELFEPWYFSQPRPVVANSPGSVRHGQTFDVIMPNAVDIRRVAITRVGSVTHGFNFDQRYVGLRFGHVAPDRLTVTAPPDGFIAPPAHYLLFVVNNSGVPSVAKFIHIDLAWEPWFALGPNTFPLGSEVAAVSTVPGGTSLFVVGLDDEHGGGRVWTNSFPDPGHPNQWVGWRPLGNNVFRPGSPSPL